MKPPQELTNEELAECLISPADQNESCDARTEAARRLRAPHAGAAGYGHQSQVNAQVADNWRNEAARLGEELTDALAAEAAARDMEKALREEIERQKQIANNTAETTDAQISGYQDQIVKLTRELEKSRQLHRRYRAIVLGERKLGPAEVEQLEGTDGDASGKPQETSSAGSLNMKEQTELDEWKGVAVRLDAKRIATKLKLTAALAAEAAARAECHRVNTIADKLLAHLDDGTHETDGECSVCSVICCPHGEPLHFHHDGCPACETFLGHQRTDEVSALTAQLAAARERCVELEKIVNDALPALREFASKNPKYYWPGFETKQDPCGVHAVVKANYVAGTFSITGTARDILAALAPAKWKRRGKGV